ncbi:MAG: hypothetical protein WA987_12635 [Cellvibrio sp.]|jgi:hypothetical protein
MDKLMIRRINVTSVIAGFLVSQGVGCALAVLLVIGLLFAYGNSVMVAFEYPSSIAITLLLTLFAIAIGGYVAMVVAKKGLVNSALVGGVSLAANVLLMHYTDYIYGADHTWLLIAAAILMIPASLAGGYLYQRTNS